MSLFKQLESFGLTENQAKIYFALLELKKTTVLQLARKIGIQRPTIYDNIARLQEMGLVSKIVERGKTLLVSEDPHNIHRFLARQQKEAQLVMPQLQELFGESSAFPEVKFFRGTEGLKRLTEIILESKEKEIRTIGSYQENIQGMSSERFLKDLWDARVRRKTKARVLFTHQDRSMLQATKAYSEIGNIRYNREVKILPETIKLYVLYTIVDDQVLFWSNNHEAYSFLFKSPSYAESLKTLFDFLWGTATSL